MLTEAMSETARRRIAATDGTVLYAGRPSWLGSGLLDDLAAEADALRGTALENRQHQYGARAGARALEFAASRDMTELITQYDSPGRVCGESTYLYYEREGAGIAPHIDRPEFSVQVLLMLRHTGYGANRSALAVFPDGPGSAVFFRLEPGELVLFRAASVVHGRTATAGEEFVNLLGLGYA
jgi:hypothetical protein